MITYCLYKEGKRVGITLIGSKHEKHEKDEGLYIYDSDNKCMAYFDKDNMDSIVPYDGKENAYIINLK